MCFTSARGWTNNTCDRRLRARSRKRVFLSCRPVMHLWMIIRRSEKMMDATLDSWMDILASRKSNHTLCELKTCMFFCAKKQGWAMDAKASPMAWATACCKTIWDDCGKRGWKLDGTCRNVYFFLAPSKPCIRRLVETLDVTSKMCMRILPSMDAFQA